MKKKKTTEIVERAPPGRILATLNLQVTVWINRYTRQAHGVYGDIYKTICEDLPVAISVHEDSNTHQGSWKMEAKIGSQKYDVRIGVTKIAFLKKSKWEVTLSIEERGADKPEASMTARLHSLKQMGGLKLYGPKTKQPKNGFKVGNKYCVPILQVEAMA